MSKWLPPGRGGYTGAKRKSDGLAVTVYLSDGGELNVADFDEESAADFLDEINGDQFLTLMMDGARVVVNPRHIVRVDLDWPES